MRKVILATLAVSLGLAGGISLPPISANAKTISGMPSYFCHTWYRGKNKVKFTKHHMWQGKTGHKFGKGYYFKHAFKFKTKLRGTYYIPGVNADSPMYKYANSHIYISDQQGHWFRYHR